MLRSARRWMTESFSFGIKEGVRREVGFVGGDEWSRWTKFRRRGSDWFEGSDEVMGFRTIVRRGSLCPASRVFSNEVDSLDKEEREGVLGLGLKPKGECVLCRLLHCSALFGPSSSPLSLAASLPRLPSPFHAMGRPLPSELVDPVRSLTLCLAASPLSCFPMLWFSTESLPSVQDGHNLMQKSNAKRECGLIRSTSLVSELD
jgi:hypothetical protein